MLQLITVVKLVPFWTALWNVTVSLCDLKSCISIHTVIFLMFGWPCILIYIHVTTKHNALFSTSFHYHASACARPIVSPSSGCQMYNVALVLVLLLSWLSVGLVEKKMVGSFSSSPTNSELYSVTSTTATLCTRPPDDGLPMGPKHVEVW
jgi:hypothetical protein